MDQQTDLGALSVVELIGGVYNMLGKATAPLLKDVGTALGRSDAPLETLQGPAEEVRPGVFVQRTCPFARAVAMYKATGKALPEGIKKLAAEAPQYGSVWVSAYCGVHQALRKAKADGTFQIACKAGDGAIKYAANDVVAEVDANALLENAACVYGIKK